MAIKALKDRIRMKTFSVCTEDNNLFLSRLTSVIDTEYNLWQAALKAKKTSKAQTHQLHYMSLCRMRIAIIHSIE